MKIYNYDIVLQEVPDEISLCITVCGCDVKCKGCHSEHIWNENSGYTFTIKDFETLLDKYKDYITCVVFMGGEWDNDLSRMLLYAKSQDLKTCLYTGKNKISMIHSALLTYVKLGRYIKELGGLESPKTNQLFYNLKTNELLNYKFLKNVH